MDQESAALAFSIYTALAPYLNIIVLKAAGKIGEGLPGNIHKIWDRIKEKFSNSPASQDTLNDLLSHVDDPDFQAAFRVQLRKLLESDTQLRAELSDLVEKEQIISGNKTTQNGIGNVSVQGTYNTVKQQFGQVQVADHITNVGFQPKTIPQNIADEIVDAMSNLPHQQVLITSNMMKSETEFLANQLGSILQKAGWDVSGDTKSMFTPNIPKGIVFIAPEESLSLNILGKYLQGSGIPVHGAIDKTKSLVTIFVNNV